jgi:Fibronectin type III domain
MRGSHRYRKTGRRPGRLLTASLLLALAIVVAVPGVAFALLSSQPPAQTASVTAATIARPTNFTATASGRTSANLSWTAPSTLTGYTLSQSPGTLAGCSGNPSSSTTSCAATGLSPGTVYTWTLTAVYNNWQSSSVQASARTTGVSASLLATATDGTSGTSSSSVSGVTTTSGATLLVLVYRSASSGNSAISSVTGSAVSGTATPINSVKIDGTYGAFAWLATGSGTSNGAVTVNFSSGNNTSTTIDIVELAGNNASTPIAASATTSGNGTSATGASLSPLDSTDGEVFFVGSAAATSMSTPAGFAALNAPASAAHGSWFGTVISKV